MPSRLWLWPNLLSLDAPLIALLWQVLFVRCFHSTPCACSPALLAGSVWLIYAADRTLDAWRCAEGEPSLRPRHEFYRRHWRAVFPCWVAAFVGCAWLAWSGLPPAEFDCGLLLLAGTGVYLAGVHALPHVLAKLRVKPRAGVKEGAVAVVFGLGTTLAAWPHLATSSDVVAIALFSALCWSNCTGIEDWENGRQVRAGVCWTSVAIALVAAVWLREHRPVLGSAETVSALGLMILDRARARLTPDAMRVLADAALASPLLFLPLAGMRL